MDPSYNLFVRFATDVVKFCLRFNGYDISNLFETADDCLPNVFEDTYGQTVFYYCENQKERFDELRQYYHTRLSSGEFDDYSLLAYVKFGIESVTKGDSLLMDFIRMMAFFADLMIRIQRLKNPKEGVKALTEFFDLIYNYAGIKDILKLPGSYAFLRKVGPIVTAARENIDQFCDRVSRYHRPSLEPSTSAQSLNHDLFAPSTSGAQTVVTRLTDSDEEDEPKYVSAVKNPRSVLKSPRNRQKNSSTEKFLNKESSTLSMHKDKGCETNCLIPISDTISRTQMVCLNRIFKEIINYNKRNSESNVVDVESPRKKLKLPQESKLEESDSSGGLPQESKLEESDSSEGLPQESKLEESGSSEGLPQESKLEESGSSESLPQESKLEESGSSEVRTNDSEDQVVTSEEAGQEPEVPLNVGDVNITERVSVECDLFRWGSARTRSVEHYELVKELLKLD